MAMSVAELDQTVQAFYEGRGEVVRRNIILDTGSILLTAQ